MPYVSHCIYFKVKDNRMRIKTFVNILIIVLFFCSCDDETKLVYEGQDSLFEIIEHAAIHMQDGSGLARAADTVMPGPHLDKDSIEHRRIDVTLPVMGAGFGGYIHFGPDITGDMIVCVDVETPLTVTNRSGMGDTPIEIEKTFKIQDIVDSAKTNLIRTAVLFEANTGGNILKLGPVNQSTVRIIIEEASHDHE